MALPPTAAARNRPAAGRGPARTQFSCAHRKRRGRARAAGTPGGGWGRPAPRAGVPASQAPRAVRLRGRGGAGWPRGLHGMRLPPPTPTPPRGRTRLGSAGRRGAAPLRSAGPGKAEPAWGGGRALGGPPGLRPPPDGRRRSPAAGRPAQPAGLPRERLGPLGSRVRPGRARRCNGGVLRWLACARQLCGGVPVGFDRLCISLSRSPVASCQPRS
ncbi:uncharacterized protein LOC142410310 [Mycteria americana]|uniref:uncharacterized protein LOC142410310 n=1 Tax=Mycteria americana TaxID=33587 RepID=UPI003F58C904